MIPLKDPLQKCLASLGGKPRAVIIDDELVNKDEKNPADWIALKDVLMGKADLYAEIQRRMAELGLPPDLPPSSEDWKEVLKDLDIRDRDALGAITQYEQKQHVLRKLEAFLSELGFDLTLLTARPNISTLQEVQLFLVDFQILPEDAGETAVQLIRELMEFSTASQRTPPMVILMSKAITSAEVQKWDGVASRAGYFRFNYDFLNKADFQEDPSLFSLLLLNLLQHKPVADCYYAQIRSLLAETGSIATNVMNDLFQVTPSEAQVFKQRVEREGATLSEVFTNLFTERFAQCLKGSPAVQERMKALEKAISEQGVLAPPGSHRHALHKLYAQLLYTDCTPTASPSPDFGDIYTDSTGKYFLVVTQECDLMSRGERGPKVDRVLAIEGTLHDTTVSDIEAASIIAKPMLKPAEDKLRWIWWDIRRPAVIAYDDLSKAPYTKLWCLKFQDAEDIQNQFSYSLARVALDVRPGFVTKHECKLFSERNDKYLDSSVSLYEIIQGDHIFLALAPDCRALFFNLRYPFIPVEEIVELGRFSPEAAFLQKLKQLRIVICEEAGSLTLFKTRSGQLPVGKRAWREKSAGANGQTVCAREQREG